MEAPVPPRRYGGFSLGAGGSQALPTAAEVDAAALELRALFNITPVRIRFCLPRCWHGSGLSPLLTRCPHTQGSPADRLLANLSRFIEGLDSRRNIKVRSVPGVP